ncbi:25517_t:CDS:1, partial [Dentiscutata erythropus]
SEGMKIAVSSITKLRNFASYIRKSQPLFEDLKRIFQTNGRPFLVPDLDVPTRWNSTYIMIEKMFRICEMTDDLVEDNPTLKDRYLNDNEWDEINVSI